MTAALALPQGPDADTADDVDHWYCCDPNVAYCGLDLTDVPEGGTSGRMCPLCELAEEMGDYCRGCGA